MQLKKLDQTDLEVFIQLLEETGLKCVFAGGIYKVKSDNGNILTCLKVLDDCIMATHELSGIDMTESYHGNRWEYYVTI